jgi:hypothetical protein
MNITMTAEMGTYNLKQTMSIPVSDTDHPDATEPGEVLLTSLRLQMVDWGALRVPGGRVTLSGPAPPDGVVVNLAFTGAPFLYSAGKQLPGAGGTAALSIPGGASAADFNCGTDPSTILNFAATLGTVTRFATIDTSFG